MYSWASDESTNSMDEMRGLKVPGSPGRRRRPLWTANLSTMDGMPLGVHSPPMDSSRSRDGRPPVSDLTPADISRLESAILDKLAQKGSDNPNGIKRAFSLFDADGSGEVSVKEFGHVLERFGVVLPSKQMRQFYSHYDADHSGTLSYAEFIAALFGQPAPTRTRPSSAASSSVFSAPDWGWLDIGQTVPTHLNVVNGCLKPKPPRMAWQNIAHALKRGQRLRAFDGDEDVCVDEAVAISKEKRKARPSSAHSQSGRGLYRRRVVCPFSVSSLPVQSVSVTKFSQHPGRDGKMREGGEWTPKDTVAFLEVTAEGNVQLSVPEWRATFHYGDVHENTLPSRQQPKQGGAGTTIQKRSVSANAVRPMQPNEAPASYLRRTTKPCPIAAQKRAALLRDATRTGSRAAHNALKRVMEDEGKSLYLNRQASHSSQVMNAIAESLGRASGPHGPVPEREAILKPPRAMGVGEQRVHYNPQNQQSTSAPITAALLRNNLIPPRKPPGLSQKAKLTTASKGDEHAPLDEVMCHKESVANPPPPEDFDFKMKNRKDIRTAAKDAVYGRDRLYHTSKKPGNRGPLPHYKRDPEHYRQNTIEHLSKQSDKQQPPAGGLLHYRKIEPKIQPPEPPAPIPAAEGAIVKRNKDAVRTIPKDAKYGQERLYHVSTGPGARGLYPHYNRTKEFYREQGLPGPPPEVPPPKVKKENALVLSNIAAVGAISNPEAKHGHERLYHVSTAPGARGLYAHYEREPGFYKAPPPEF